MTQQLGRCAAKRLSSGLRAAGRPNAPLGIRVRAASSASPQTTAGNAAESVRGSPRICILGGGFGGLYTAVRLDSLMWPRGKKPQVTLVDRSERFVFKPLLYELLNGGAQPWEVAPAFTQLLAPYPIRFLQGKVESVQLGEAGSAAGGVVTLGDGTQVEYDYLVVALGSQADARGVPGVKELAIPFNNFADATKVAARLEELEGGYGGGRVMLVGAGYVGVELASVVAERLRGKAEVQVVAAGPTILEGSPAGQREAAEAVLRGLGVEVVAGTKVQELRQRSTEDGSPAPAGSCVAVLQRTGDDGSQVVEEQEVDLLLWTAGASPATRLSTLPFPTTPAGALLVEPTLQVSSHPNTFAVGDTTLVSDPPSGGALPPTAQVAFQQADYAAWNLWAAINGRPLLPFRYQHLGSMMALGQLNAAVALPFSLPPPLRQTLEEGPLGRVLEAAGVKLGSSEEAGSDSGVTLEGPLAAALRRAAYLYRQPTNEQRINVATSWVQQAIDLAAKGGLPLPGVPSRK